MNDLSKATEAASLAIQFDKLKDVNKAIECYRTAARCLDKCIRPDYNVIPSRTQNEMRVKVREYLDRAAALEAQHGKINFSYYRMTDDSLIIMYFL